MRYMVSWTLPMGKDYFSAVDRFLNTRGAAPPGVTILGRWHGMNRHGFAIAGCDDQKALYSWVTQWADLLDLWVTPCLTDEETGDVLQSAHGSAHAGKSAQVATG